MGRAICRRCAGVLCGMLAVGAPGRAMVSAARGEGPGTGTEAAGSPAAAPAGTSAAVGETGGEAANFDSSLTGGWWGGRGRLQDAGISVGGGLTLEGFDNLRGGIDTAHRVGASTLDLNLTLDAEKLLHVPGGEFYVDLEDHAFRNPSRALVGDLQVFDKQNTSPYLQIFELWYQQQFLEGKVRIKVGKVDANTEFSVIDNALPFINSSTQVSPTVFVFPTTPDPMPSIDVFLTPSDACYASVGVFDANSHDRFGELVDDPARTQRAKHGAFLIGESGVKWHTAPLLGLAGNLNAGVWGDTGKFTRFDGSGQRGTYGYYSIFDQTLWQPAGEAENGRGVRSFLEYGGTQSTINVIDRHFGGGLTWTGLIPGRPGDIIGVSTQLAHLSDQARLSHAYELAVEGFYQWQLAHWASVQPDLQYIVHPGGVYADALVATVRLQISF